LGDAMRRFKLIGGVIAVVISLSGICRAEERAEAKELLGRYRQTIERLGDFYIAAMHKTVEPMPSDANMEGKSPFSEWTFVRHGRRFREGGVHHRVNANGDESTTGNEHLVDDRVIANDV